VSAGCAITGNDRNKLKPWTACEIEQIVAANRPLVSKLSKRLGRSVQAIQMQRSRLLNATNPRLVASKSTALYWVTC
jgi:hypothetical protein